MTDLEELSPEHREEVLLLLKTYGRPKSLKYLADYLDVDLSALKTFLASKEAKKALAAHDPSTRDSAIKHLDAIDRDRALELAIPESQYLKGLQGTIHSILPDVPGLLSYLQRKKSK